MSQHPKNILIGVSGSISTYKVCEVISHLKKQGHDIKVMATRSALEFVGKASFEGLTGHPVLTDDFTDGAMMSHIDLAKWADTFLVAPATAQTLNSLAHGTGGGILISTYLAYDLRSKPLLIAPAMNTKMLEHPTTQSSIKRLKEMGVDVLATGAGDLACGDVGLGRLLEPQALVKAVEDSLAPPKNISILITAGGTKVPIDSVRSITNTSTGATGVEIADALSRRGYTVDLLLSENGPTPQRTRNVTRFSTYHDLARLMETAISHRSYDVVIHAAAVSDFHVVQTPDGKLHSGSAQSLQLEPTRKLLGLIKTWSATTQVVGFKLTDTKLESERNAAIDKIFAQGADWVVHNDLSEISKDHHRFTLLDSKKQRTLVEGKFALSEALEKQIFTKTSARAVDHQEITQ